MKMPGSALFPDEPAPQTAAKKFPEGRSPPGPEKKKHTSAAAPAKKIGEHRARLSYAFPNIGQTLALLPPMVLGLIAEGNAPLPGAERKAVGTRPSASGRRGGLFAPLPCLTPADGTGALFSYSQQISSAGTSEPACVNLGQSRFLDHEFAAQTRREVSEAYRPVSGLTLPPSVVLELSSVLSVMDSRSISPSAMTYWPRVRVRNSQAS